MPNLSLRMWGLIGSGFAILVLVIALMATRATLESVKRERDLAETKLKVSNASISSLEGEIDKALAQQIDLANSDRNRINASKQTLELIDIAEAARQSIIDRLRVSATVERAPSETCEPSEEVIKAWP